LRNLISDFADSERKRAQAEAVRIEAERRQAEEAALQARLAEEKRVREEAEVRLRAAKDASDRARIEDEAKAAVERAKAEQERAQRLADERAAMDRQMHAPAVAQGQSVRTEWQLDIVDIWALARAHPACVTITPRLSEIKALLDAGAKVVGVSAKRVTIAGVRTAGRTIDV
jgi:multidrug efflux pump subunit AcrA (membrane-fusion protein)